MDLDNDGDLDLVVNIINDKAFIYENNSNKKATYNYLRVKPIDKNNHQPMLGTRVEVIQGKSRQLYEFPLRGRSCSSQQVPSIGQQFETYNIFASASLTDVYGEYKLQSALHYQAKTLASAYLENRGKGKFKITPLPNEALVSSINDIIIKDVDGDGNQDILVAGNMFPVEVEPIRNDAGVGLYLEGDGNGGFTSISPIESGFFLPNDVKKLILNRSKGATLVLGAVNNGMMRSFSIKNDIR